MGTPSSLTLDKRRAARGLAGGAGLGVAAARTLGISG